MASGELARRKVERILFLEKVRTVTGCSVDVTHYGQKHACSLVDGETNDRFVLRTAPAIGLFRRFRLAVPQESQIDNLGS